MDKEELIAKLAKILQGLQVPRSISGSMTLGVALEPYDEVCRAVGFGWKDEGEFEDFLTKVLS